MSTELQEILAFVESVALKDHEAGRALHAIVGYLAKLEGPPAAPPTPEPTPAPTTKSSKEVTNNGN